MKRRHVDALTGIRFVAAFLVLFGPSLLLSVAACHAFERPARTLIRSRLKVG